jgi:MoaA/NifB/PqqE/SkfB family radical SAM enzyme
MDMPIKRVYFEIVGRCNAKCAYCITGNGSQKGGMVDLEKFKYTIQLLFKKNLVNYDTIFNLYNWGEPFLHPQFNEIISFLSEKNIKFYLSSNLSIIPKNITKDAFSSCQGITISMPGFSQNSYDKIHGFDFHKILSNINQLTNFIQADKLLINYHLYQFNLSEIKIAQEYFKNLGMKIFSSFAYFNDYNMAVKYLTNDFSIEEFRKVTKELYLYYVDDLLKEMPLDYICPQFSQMNIDENCNIVQCCATPANSKDYFVCELKDFTIDKFVNRKEKDICKECYNTKWVYWAHNTTAISTKFIHGIVK